MCRRQCTFVNLPPFHSSILSFALSSRLASAGKHIHARGLANAIWTRWTRSGDMRYSHTSIYIGPDGTA